MTRRKIFPVPMLWIVSGRVWFHYTIRWPNRFRVPEIPAHVSEYVRERNENDREYALAAARKPAPVKLEKDNE